ncbi:hypothetical protein C8T65DRAFT_698873 [Cerioporus squamosus]|nr:hypothetical protein C8T65DRAFT_698873 [Cerioporus squamosus]
MFAVLLSMVLAATAVVALPSAVPRQTSSLCQAGGPSFGNGGPYTLSAINKTDLVFSPPVGSISSDLRSLALTGTLQTIQTYSNDEFPTVKLVDGGLEGLTPNGPIGIVGLDVDAGKPTNFGRPNAGAAKVYCGLVGTSPTASLICRGASEFFDHPLDILVYKAQDNEAYDLSSCREVAVQLVEA